MRSTSLGELLPQWSKYVVTDLSGRDPLGLARVAANITDFLLPGIVVATDRARYYAIYSWILANIQATESANSPLAFSEAFQKRESAFAVATLLQNDESSPVGKRAVERELEKAETDIRTAFKVLPSNDLGGYGQYYGGSLYNLNLTHRPEGQFDQPTDARGKRLAQAIAKTIEKTPWIVDGAFRSRRVSLEVLKKSASRLSLDAIGESFAAHERAALTDMFFGFDELEVALPSQRRLTLSRLLDLIRSYENAGVPLGQSDGVTLDDQLVLGPAFYGSLVDSDGHAAAPYTPPSFLAPCNDMWRQFCLHELCSWVLDSTLHSLLSLLADAPSAALTMDEVVDSLSGSALINAMGEFTGLSASTPRALLAELGVAEVPTSISGQKARSKYSLSADLNEDVLMRVEARDPVTVLARALPTLALLFAKWRDGSDDSAWKSVRPMVGAELAPMSLLPRVDAWLKPTRTWSEVVRSLLDLVVANHDRIMYEKGRLEACWVHREGERLVHDQDYGVAYPAHASRHRSALGILVDLGLARVDDDGTFGTTAEGEAVRQRAQEIGR
jgi:hypothetical protein